MANETKTFLDLVGLTSYDGKIKEYIGTEDAKSIKYAAVSEDGNNLLLYKVTNPTVGTTTPDFTIPMGSTALKNFVKSLGTAVGATLDTTNDTYSVTFTGGLQSYTDVVSAVQALDGMVGTLGSLSTEEKSNLVGAINEVLGAISTAIQGLDVAEFALAEKDSNTNVVTIHGISEADGEIAVGSNSANDVTLAAVAATGDAADVAYDNTASGLTATDAQAAIDELAEASAGGVASKTVYITETAGGSGAAYSKRYTIYQGAEGSAAEPEVTERLVDIDIPKDMVVEAGVVVNVVFDSSDDTLHEGSISGTDVTEEIKGSETPTAEDAGEYIKLTIANAASSHLWIKASDLVDIYTSGSDPATDEVVISISNNQITASVGSVGIASTKVNYAIPDKYNEDDTVTDANFDTKVAAGLYTKSGNTYTQVTTETFDENETYYTKVDAHNETVQAALTRIDAALGDGSVDQKITAAVNALDATALPFATYTAGTSGAADTIVINGGVKEVDGVIADGEGDTITLSTITSAQINNLFPSS